MIALMAADSTATRVITDTLTAATTRILNLTGPGRRVEFVHHGDATTAVYIGRATTEAGLPTLSEAGDNLDVLLPGERLVMNVPRSPDGTVWINMRSSGIPTVTVSSLPGGK